MRKLAQLVRLTLAISCGVGSGVWSSPSDEEWRDRELVQALIDDITSEPALMEELAGGGLRLTLPGHYNLEDLNAPGDVDGDGADDLFMSATMTQRCGASAPHAFVRLVSGKTGEHRSNRGYIGIPRIRFGESAQGSRAMLIHCYVRHYGNYLALHRQLDTPPVWELQPGDPPVGDAKVACFVSDVDGDGVIDVAVGNSGAQDASNGRHDRVGAIALLSGSTRRPLWTRIGQSADEVYGLDVIPAGDHDQDGIEDLAVLVGPQPTVDRGSRLDLLSGKDGSRLVGVELRYLWPKTMTLAGDLDADGYEEILLDQGRSGILCMRELRRLELAPGWKIAWAAPAGDLDGQGWDVLVLALIERSTGEKRISVASAHGLRREAWPSLGERAWSARVARVGDFDGDRVWDLALLLQAGRSERHRLRNEVWITAGR